MGKKNVMSLDSETYADILRRILIYHSKAGVDLSITMEGMDAISPDQAIGLVPTEDGFNVIVVELEEPAYCSTLGKHLN